MEPKPPTTDTAPLLEFMVGMGQAYLACGEQTAEVESILRRIATARGLRRPRVVAFPTAVYISVSDEAGEHVTLASGATQRMRLDQIAAIYSLGDEAQRGGVSPRDGLERLDGISQMPPRFGVVGVILGHSILSIGLAIALMPSVTNVIVAAVLGTIVGTFKAVNQDRPILSAPLSVVSAGLASSLVLLALKYGVPIDTVYALMPPLVTFLPGGMLAFGLIELTTGDMVSGSSRLISGFVQLVLLALGLVAGALLVGHQPVDLLDGYTDVVVPLWTSAVGVVVFGVGIFMHFSAPPRSLPWMLVVLFAAFGGQRLTSGSVGPEISGFFGMLGATMLGNLIEYRFRGPPAMVTFLPSFWLMVPTVLALISVKRILLTDQAGLDGLINVVFAFTSIALGTLVGESSSKWLAAKFRWTE